MSDIFYEKLPLGDVQRIFELMEMANWHIFQLLTKRPERLLELSSQLPWREHIWMGTSVESREHLDRSDYLRRSAAKVKFLSLEPLLEKLPKLNLRGIDWVIVGGESEQTGLGKKVRKPRPMKLQWARDIKRQCRKTGVAFFCKQLGSVWARKHEADSPHGEDPAGRPKDLRVREYPRGVKVMGGQLITQIEGTA
jgi:protein gp37